MTDTISSTTVFDDCMASDAPRSAAQLFSFKENANTADSTYHNPRVFFDMQIGAKRVGRLVMELFADVVPKTAEVCRRGRVVTNALALPSASCGGAAELSVPLHW